MGWNCLAEEIHAGSGFGGLCVKAGSVLQVRSFQFCTLRLRLVRLSGCFWLRCIVDKTAGARQVRRSFWQVGNAAWVSGLR